MAIGGTWGQLGGAESMAAPQTVPDLGVNFFEPADVTMVLDKTVAIASAMCCPPTTAAIRPDHKSKGNIAKKSVHRWGVKPRKGQTCEKFLSPHN